MHRADEAETPFAEYLGVDNGVIAMLVSAMTGQLQAIDRFVAYGAAIKSYDQPSLGS